VDCDEPFLLVVDRGKQIGDFHQRVFLDGVALHSFQAFKSALTLFLGHEQGLDLVVGHTERLQQGHGQKTVKKWAVSCLQTADRGPETCSGRS
jgi:hypothetical protein